MNRRTLLLPALLALVMVTAGCRHSAQTAIANEPAEPAEVEASTIDAPAAINAPSAMGAAPSMMSNGCPEQDMEYEYAPVAPEEDASGFVLLTDVIPEAILEMRYFSTYNFIGDRIPGYEEPVALLTRPAADSLKAVSDELLAKGYRLKIFDAYRPQCAVDYFVKWARDVNDVRMKEYFYPEISKASIIPSGYISTRSGHTRGSTVDLTLFDMASQKEVDMGCTFDYFGLASHPMVQPGEPVGAYKPINREQYELRQLLRSTMSKHGFKPISTEWWHFTLRGEPYPDTYFTFPVRTESVRTLR